MIDSLFPFPVKTNFRPFTIPAIALLKGISLADTGGECIGVRLYLNGKVNDTVTNADTAANLRVVWFGDAENQSHELQAGNYSHLIYCTDLAQIFVRGNGVENPHLQVWIYTRA